MSQRPPVRVAHVTAFPGYSQREEAELRRVFGADVEIVDISPIGRTPEELAAALRSQDPDAIYLKPAGAPYTASVRAYGLETNVPVVEAIRREQQYDDSWQKRRNIERRTVEHFDAIGRRNEHGELTPLRDGELLAEIELRREQQHYRKNNGYEY